MAENFLKPSVYIDIITI